MRSRLPLLKDLPVEVAVLASIAFFVALGFGMSAASSSRGGGGGAAEGGGGNGGGGGRK